MSAGRRPAADAHGTEPPAGRATAGAATPRHTMVPLTVGPHPGSDLVTAATPHAQPTRVAFESADSREAEAYIGELRGVSVRVDGLGSGRAMRHQGVTTGGLAIHQIDYPPLLGLASEPIDRPIVVDLLAGRFDRRGPVEGLRYGAGDLTLYAMPGAAGAGTFHDAVIRTTMVDLRLGTDTRPAPRRLAGLEPVSPAAAAAWRRACHYAQAVLDDEVVSAEPLVVDSVARLLAATTMAAFPTAATDPTPADGRDSRSATVRRAVAFIEADPRAQIGPAEIAQAACVSVRALQLAFRRHLDTTPMAYLRDVRLSHAHAELEAADPAVETVAGIAARWGFVNQGRFARRYRQVYGCAPSRSLHDGSAGWRHPDDRPAG